MALSIAIGCARGVPPPPAPLPSTAPEEVVAAPSPVACPLEPERPAALSIHVVRAVIPIGDSPRRQVAELATSLAQCTEPAPLCRVPPVAVLDALYASFRARGLAQARPRPAHASPHSGSLFVTLTWPNGACEVGESPTTELPPEQRAALVAMEAEIVTAFHALDGRSDPAEPPAAE